MLIHTPMENLVFARKEKKKNYCGDIVQTEKKKRKRNRSCGSAL